MPTTLRHKRGTTAELSAQTGTIGEIAIDTSKKTVVVFDGTTLGGIPLAGSAIATTSAAGLMSSADKTKLDGISDYTLPQATNTTLGGVIVDGSTITASNGVISAVPQSTYTLPQSTTTTLGGVIVDGTSITINGAGVISALSNFDGDYNSLANIPTDIVKTLNVQTLQNKSHQGRFDIIDSGLRFVGDFFDAAGPTNGDNTILEVNRRELTVQNNTREINRSSFGIPNYSNNLVITGPTGIQYDENDTGLPMAERIAEYNSQFRFWQFRAAGADTAIISNSGLNLQVGTFQGDGSNITNIAWDNVDKTGSFADDQTAGLVRGLTNNNGGANTAIGINSQNAMTYDSVAPAGDQNTSIGSSALASSTAGRRNTAVGRDALRNSQGDSNVAVGQAAGRGLTEGNQNIAIGQAAISMYSGQTAGTTIQNNIAMGRNTLANMTGLDPADGVTPVSADQNVAVGNESLNALQVGTGNVAQGTGSANQLVEGSNNVVVGHYAGSQIAAGGALTEGNNLVLIGNDARPSVDAAADEITLGNFAHNRLRIPGLGLDTNSANAGEVLQWNGSAFTWANASGGASNIDGLSDVDTSTSAPSLNDLLKWDGTNWIPGTINNATTSAPGVVLAKTDNTDNANNSAFGQSAMSNTVGDSAGGTGINITAVGTAALLSNVSGKNLTAVGRSALRNSTGDENTAVGATASQGLTEGARNSSFGHGALAMYSGQTAGTTITDNTAIGRSSLQNLTGLDTADGVTPVNTTWNVAVGGNTLNALQAGENNTGIGSQAGVNLTEGSENVFIGQFAGGLVDAGGNFTNGSNNLAIGNSARMSADAVSNEITIGNSSHDRLRIPGLGLDTNDASTGNVLAWDGSGLSWQAPSGLGAWQVVDTGPILANAGDRFMVDSTTNSVQINLPGAPTTGDEVHIIDAGNNASVNNIIVGRNGYNLQHLAEDMTVATNAASFKLIFVNATLGWVLAYN
jgi:hypothetical protein